MAGTINEYTVMYFFAGDNDLAPVVVSQLKAVKDAGFQEHTDVLVYFDPNEQGVPTKIYHVNHERRRQFKGKRKSRIGDGNDPFVHNMDDDDIEEQLQAKAAAKRISAKRALDIIRGAEAARESGAAGNGQEGNGKVRQVVKTTEEATVTNALTVFLDYCQDNHPAKRYILILLGHGMIVGNDTFLPDENPVSSVRLNDFGKMLVDFKGKIQKHDGVLDLIAMHSCSMSAVEVAYALKGTARYMMASEGPSFVGSWPYRKLLIKTFNTVERARNKGGVSEKEADKLVESLYHLSLFSATDYMRAGYSLDLGLCNLAEEKFKSLATDVKGLVAQLKAALKSERGEELILLAHWKAQSYWGESYTDLYDFCRCLRKLCGGDDDELRELADACEKMMEALKPHPSVLARKERRPYPARFDRLVVHSDNFGSEYQYSHGLSVYFPWSRPVEEEDGGGMEAYKKYAFSIDLGSDSWASFLDAYFKTTVRDHRIIEDEEDGVPRPTGRELRSARRIFNPGGVLSGQLSNPSDPKSSPSVGSDPKSSPSVGGCGCPSIKNYPVEPPPEATGKKRGRAESVLQGKRGCTRFHATQGPLDAFKK